MNSVESKFQFPRGWLWPLAVFLFLMVMALVVQSWVNHEPGQDLVAQETRNLRQLESAIWSGSPDKDFSNLSTASAVQAHLIPAPMLRSSGALVRSGWGGAIVVEPHGVRSSADGFLVRYELLPSLACTQLTRAMTARAYDIRVNGDSVLPSGGAQATDVSRACAMGQATVDFVFHPDLIPGTALPRS